MPVRPFPTPRSPRARRFRCNRLLSSPPLHRGALEPAPAAGTAAPDDAMATDASDATAPRPAPPAPPARKPRARRRSDEAGPSSVDSMDHDDEHRGRVSEAAAKKRRSRIAREAPPGAAQVARARAAALPPDVAHRCAMHARPHNLPPTALWGRPLRLPLLHKSSTPRRPRSSLRRRSGRCLPAAGPAPPNAHVHALTGLRPGCGCSPAMSQWMILISALRSSSQL